LEHVVLVLILVVLGFWLFKTWRPRKPAPQPEQPVETGEPEAGEPLATVSEPPAASDETPLAAEPEGPFPEQRTGEAGRTRPRALLRAMRNCRLSAPARAR
jgi:hypothetical protein